MPYAEDEDTRKVQTAVIGRAESDWPAFLPYDRDDFDQFMRGRTRDDFYCGILLGGCGKKLTPRRYTDKKCHFAHRPPLHCRRAEIGEDSADHLYIGRAVADWLKEQGQRAVQPVYRPKGHQVRDAVDVSYKADRGLIRVQFARRSKREWEQADAELRARHPELDWLFGPDSLLANWQIERHGYALRVQCRSLGATRAVEIGTQFPDMSVEWTSLSECTLTLEGIVTPSLVHTPNGIVPGRDVPAEPELPPPGLPLTPASVLITDAAPSHATDTHRWFDVSLRVNARLSLPAQAVPPDDQHTYLPMEATLRLDSDGTWLVEAGALHRVPTETPGRTPGGAAPSAATHDPTPEEQPLPERLPVHPTHSGSNQANPPSRPRHAARRRPPGRIGGEEAEFRAALDALIDLTHEARHAGDLDAFEKSLLLAERVEQAAPSTDAHEILRDLTDWLVDRRADELDATWKRLSALVAKLNHDGDDLHPDQLRNALRTAEGLAEDLGDDLAAEERQDIARWRRHLERTTERLDLAQIRGHAVAVRVALQRAARNGRTVTWGDLALRTGASLRNLHPDDKIAVLVEADRETPDDMPPLSALVTAPRRDRPHSLYSQILFNLDRPAPPAGAVFMHWRMALRRHSDLQWRLPSALGHTSR
ncbi:competence protein CoiA family protein [Streptomyces sp. NBC_00328]|uniref:competence protein CoiA family protein n=1 Tax=Streptomyces sp. NBC_00328 TaxID=2903646 RepID=UPI002E2B38AC|nr:competence protein CoiA family protein [Streptomyces sp. NBC_00328]